MSENRGKTGQNKCVIMKRKSILVRFMFSFRPSYEGFDIVAQKMITPKLPHFHFQYIDHINPEDPRIQTTGVGSKTVLAALVECFLHY